jgi:NH3-dependent NAD+ synthetase
MMPSPYTAEISWVDARDMAQRMRVRYDEMSIVPEFEAFLASLKSDFDGTSFGYNRRKHPSPYPWNVIDGVVQ